MKILVISSNLIGDTILSTGVIENFYRKYPDAKFTFLIGPTASQIYQHFPGLDKIIKIRKKSFNLHWIEMYMKNADRAVLTAKRVRIIQDFMTNPKDPR